MPVTCPFCGIVVETPHETQQGCIDALQGEIARVRGILDSSQLPGDAPVNVEKRRASGPDEPEQ